MPDDWQMFRGIDWRQVLPFTHIFRAFRIAIHPSKLLLGLLLLLSVYAGGRVLDAVWPDKDKTAIDSATRIDEISMFQLAPTGADFETARTTATEHIGIFRAFFEYEVHQFAGVVASVRSNQWVKTPDQIGVTGFIYYFLVIGPLWLAQVHTVFALLFGILFLSAWSLFGGAISRLTAVHVARDEKISIRAAMNFAMGKFLSFASAPIIPVLITLAVGLLLALAALLGNIPFLGPIVIGVMFWLALLAGFVQALVILGAVGGFNLMYPTIAVEGSDSFDAISRSFSYIYARPWRMVFYTAVAIAYGALTYLFVRYFILLMLTLAHHFVAMGMIFSPNVNGGPLWPTMWPSPAQTGRLTYAPDYSALNWGGKVGAGMLGFWIYLIIGILGAFAISFYFAANTIIYFLLRRDLDATEMDDVYLEQSDEEFFHSASVDQSGGGEVVVTEVVVTDTAADPAAPVDEPLNPAGS
jgi:hypothetical protein